MEAAAPAVLDAPHDVGPRGILQPTQPTGSAGSRVRDDHQTRTAGGIATPVPLKVEGDAEAPAQGSPQISNQHAIVVTAPPQNGLDTEMQLASAPKPADEAASLPFHTPFAMLQAAALMASAGARDVNPPAACSDSGIKNQRISPAHDGVASGVEAAADDAMLPTEQQPTDPAGDGTEGAGQTAGASLPVVNAAGAAAGGAALRRRPRPLAPKKNALIPRAEPQQRVQKVVVRREKNRLAARKCRAKKMQFILDMESKVKDLEVRNDEMKLQLAAMQKMLIRESVLREAVKKLMACLWSPEYGPLPNGCALADIVTGLEAGTLDVNAVLAAMGEARDAAASGGYCAWQVPGLPQVTSSGLHHMGRRYGSPSSQDMEAPHSCAPHMHSSLPGSRSAPAAVDMTRYSASPNSCSSAFSCHQLPSDAGLEYPGLSATMSDGRAYIASMFPGALECGNLTAAAAQVAAAAGADLWAAGGYGLITPVQMGTERGCLASAQGKCITTGIVPLPMQPPPPVGVVASQLRMGAGTPDAAAEEHMVG